MTALLIVISPPALHSVIDECISVHMTRLLTFPYYVSVFLDERCGRGLLVWRDLLEC